MKIYRTTGFIVLSLFTAFFLAACGGGGDGGSGGGGAVKTPVTTTLAALPINIDNATLNGAVNPNGDNTIAWFEWGTDSGLSPFNKTPNQSIGSGSADIPLTFNLTSLASGTTYYFRVAASNSSGTVKGAIVPFTTAAPNTPPSVQTLAATNFTITSATLNGSVIPNALATTAWFQWGTDNTFTNPAVTNETTHKSIGAGTTSVQVIETLTSLQVDTAYYFRVVAQNSAGAPQLGLTAPFRTSANSPTVTTQAADPVTTDNATLHGLVTPNGLTTTALFQWGTDNTFTTFSTTTSQAVGSALTAQPVSAPITGLTLGTKYYFKISANNSAGTSEGTILNFTTVNPLPTAKAGSDQTVYMLGASGPTEVTLDGSGSADGGGGTLTYLWTPPAGVTLSDPTAAKPTFTAPVVDYDTAALDLQFSLAVTSSRGPVSVADNVTVTVKWAFLDDFSIDTTGTYTVIDNTWAGGGTGSFTWVSQAARVVTGTSTGLLFDHPFNLVDVNELPIKTNQGVFSLNFTLRNTHGSGGGIEIRVGESFTDCYLISTLDGVLQRISGGVPVDNTALPPLTSTGAYWVKIAFTADQITVDIPATGQPLTTLTTGAPVPVDHFFVTTVEQDVDYDNITLDVVY